MKKSIFFFISSLFLLFIVFNINKISKKSIPELLFGKKINLGLSDSKFVRAFKKLNKFKIYSDYKSTIATYFWVGEAPSASNGHIANLSSAWDERWSLHYGGKDKPGKRCNFLPCSFTPKQNPFYFALPYNDIGPDGSLKKSAKKLIWYNNNEHKKSILKNKWVEIIYNNKVCYSQWEDVGPFEEDDFDYVFGTNQAPKNQTGVKAGIDLSPATWDCLGLKTNSTVKWKFIDEKTVPAGPWKKIVTKSGVFYN